MLSEGPRITILVTGDCRSSVNGSRLMLSWTISICISNTVSSHLHYYSRSKTAYLKSIRRGGGYPTIALIGCCGYVNHFTTFFFQSESVLQMVKWVSGTKHTEYFPPGGQSNCLKVFFPPLQLCDNLHCSRGFVWVYVQKQENDSF